MRDSGPIGSEGRLRHLVQGPFFSGDMIGVCDLDKFSGDRQFASDLEDDAKAQ